MCGGQMRKSAKAIARDLSHCENGFGRIPTNTQTIEREPAASFKPRPDYYQN
jgi:hypothetical protein